MNLNERFIHKRQNLRFSNCTDIVTDAADLTVPTADCECINSTYTHTHTFLSSAPIWFMSMVTLSVFHTHEWLVKYSSTIMALCNRVIVFIILRRHGNNAGSEREKRRDTQHQMSTEGGWKRSLCLFSHVIPERAYALMRADGDRLQKQF